jgi:Zn-dependent protease with chaperone function
MIAGEAVFYDGSSSARHSVTVEAAPECLRIRGADGTTIAEWPYGELKAQSAPDAVMRLARAGGAALARLEVREPALIAEIDRLADTLDRTGRTERRTRTRVVFWIVAATVSLVLVAVFGVPMLSDRIAPLIPLSVEHRFGLAIDAQVRSVLDTRKSDKPFECGGADDEKAGRAALDRMIGRLHAGAGLPIPLAIAVVRRRETNAIALPGGHIYVFEGLVRRSQSPDELAGVIAHEIGHVAHRDGTRAVLQSAGLSFLFGMLLGDFTGGGVVVIAAKTVVQSAYSREVEAAADLYGVRLMQKIGGDPRAFAAILQRIAGAIEPGFKMLRDHPQTKDRVAAVTAAAGAPQSATQSAHEPLLTPAEWAALKRICG